MKLNISQNTFNYIRMNVCPHKKAFDGTTGALYLEFRKNLRDGYYDNVTEIEFQDAFMIAFTKKTVNYNTVNNEHFCSFEIPLNSIHWGYIHPKYIVCRLSEINDVPDIFVESFKDETIRKITKVQEFKNKIMKINGYEFKAEWEEPLKELQINVNEGQTIVDLNEYNLDGVDLLIIAGFYQFEVVNLPDDFYNDDHYGDQLGFYLLENIGDYNQFNIQLNAIVDSNRNVKKYLRKK